MNQPTGFRFVTLNSGVQPSCPYQVFWQDSLNTANNTLIFQYTASQTAEMIELEIGAASTYATIWYTKKLRQSCKNSCPARS